MVMTVILKTGFIIIWRCSYDDYRNDTICAQNYKVQNSHLTPKLPNGSLPPKGHVNPYCPEGMDITGRTDFRRIVPVDEGVANKIKSLVFERMEKNGGMSGGEIESKNKIRQK